eukprot:753551-Hanusia_phi.AAC.4
MLPYHPNPLPSCRPDRALDHEPHGPGASVPSPSSPGLRDAAPGRPPPGAAGPQAARYPRYE